MKKAFSLILTAVLLLSLGGGCGKRPKERVEINICVPELVMDCIAYPECRDSAQFIQAAWDEFTAQYTKYTVALTPDPVTGVPGVHRFGQTEYRENIPAKYGTAEAVDLTFGGYFTLGSYICDGYVIPLDDIITDKIFYDFSGGTWALSKGTNGKVYMLPFYSLQNILCYDRELFRQCGLERYLTDDRTGIQGWSTEDWEIILSTLSERLPEGVRPMMMYAKNDQGDTHTMVQLRCKGSRFYDGNGSFDLNTPEGIAGLQWLKDNYDKGYYPAGCEDMEILDCERLFIDGKLAIYLYNSSIGGDFAGKELGFVNFPGADSHGANSDWVTGFMAFDNGNKKKIEVIKDFLKYIYNSDKLMDYSTGGNPCSKNVVERWHEYLPLDYAFVENSIYSVDFTLNNPNWPGVREAFWPHIRALLTGAETAEEAAAGIDRDCNAAMSGAERRLHG